MNILLLTSHSIAEYDDVRMFTDLGYDVFSIGAYSNPHEASEFRPALPDAPNHPELAALCHAQRVQHAEESHEWAVDWAKADLHPDLIEWADIIVAHHYLDRWVVPQWQRIKHKRVIWRTCGQSDPPLERLMAPLRREGLEIVRYSPKEREWFEKLGVFAGEDALIRFGKYLDDYPRWVGGDYVANVTQDMKGRGDWCGLSYWLEATEGLNAKPAGPHSEKLPGGVGALDYPDMLQYLAHAGAYLYMGTSPASYTLGLIEAMAVGVPVVSMGAERFMVPPLFEAPELVQVVESDPAAASGQLRHFLDRDMQAYWLKQSDFLRGQHMNAGLFDVRAVAPQWAKLLGTPIPRAWYDGLYFPETARRLAEMAA